MGCGSSRAIYRESPRKDLLEIDPEILDIVYEKHAGKPEGVFVDELTSDIFDLLYPIGNKGENVSAEAKTRSHDSIYEFIKEELAMDFTIKYLLMNKGVMLEDEMDEEGNRILKFGEPRVIDMN